jgi:very-short-patch-repair endonuclease
MRRRQAIKKRKPVIRRRRSVRRGGQGNVYKALMRRVLDDIPDGVIPEYKFLTDRKFRFDYAIPDKKIAVEYEGIMGGKARHTSVTGYTKDTEKYNLAAINGWRVLRYTALNVSNLKDDLQKILSEG